jgi:CDP-glucose 4,6-dehydratase
LSGYLCLAQALAQPQPRLGLDSAFNFGPGHESNRTVQELIAEILKHAQGKWVDQSNPNAPHEASFLQLSTDKANALLGWSPTWQFPEAIRHTVTWYEASRKAVGPQEFQALTRGQIDAYAASSAKQKTVPAAV